jgi:YggT family protein
MSYVVLHTIYVLLSLLLQLAFYLVIAAVIVSWLVVLGVLNTSNPTVRQILGTLDKVTEPLFRPFRRLVPPVGGLDLSPVLVIIVIYVLEVFVDDLFGYLLLHYTTL